VLTKIGTVIEMAKRILNQWCHGRFISKIGHDTGVLLPRLLVVWLYLLLGQDWFSLLVRALLPGKLEDGKGIEGSN